MAALMSPLLQPLFEIGIVGERRLLDEIGRAPQLLEIGAALGALIVVEHGEGQIVDVGRNAEAEHQHQQRRAEQAEAEPDRVAQQLQGLADRIGEQPPQAEPRARRRRADAAGGSCRRAGAAAISGGARIPSPLRDS